ncbi:MAG: polysaccharide deacetylase family protein [Candidatus Riflebacteria bacterium]
MAVLLFSGLLIIAILAWNISKARSFQLFGEIISRVDTEEKVAALTFDDGPSAECTEEVLKILEECQIKATFFLTGNEIEKNMQQARMIAQKGHEIGNHSFSHQRMILRSWEFISYEIERTDEAIKAAGFKGPIYFRPPFGKKLLMLPWYLADQKRTTVMWDVEPETFSGEPESAEIITARTVSAVRPGSIILLHPMYKSREQTRKSLKPVIENLKSQGYRLTTVSDLIRLKK